MNHELNEIKVAVIHDWLIVNAGAEKVLSGILEIFPRADLFCLFDFFPDDDRLLIQNKRAFTSFLQKLPLVRRHYRCYAPLFPLAVEQFDLKAYDLVISSSHAVAKGVLTGPDQLHIAYVHTPMRYAWDLQSLYLAETGLNHNIRGVLAKLLLHYLRLWDCRSVNGVDAMIANSQFTRARIRKFYGCDAKVIYPPVDMDYFSLGGSKQDFYLTVGRMVPYKRMDLIVDAFAEMPDKKLLVIGDGPQRYKIKSRGLANVSVLGHQPLQVVRDHMQRAKAFIFAAEEDFGITPIEAQACGTPVIAYGRGGCLETVRNHDRSEPTGLFFAEQNKASIRKALMFFEANEHKFRPENCRKHAMKFAARRFKEDFEVHVEELWQDFKRKQYPQVGGRTLNITAGG